MNNYKEQLKPFLARARKLSHLISILNFDLETKAPPQAIESQSDLISDYVGELAKIDSDPEFMAIVKAFYEEKDLDPRDASLAKQLYRSAELTNKVGVEKIVEWNKVISKCTEMWHKAKVQNDYSLVLPYFEKAVEAIREKASAMKMPKHKTLYDVLLEDYEAGSSEEVLDSIFDPLLEFLSGNLEAALKKQSLTEQKDIPLCPIHEQRYLTDDLLKIEGFDMERGCVGETEHPFTDWPSRHDFRVTTHYYENDFRMSMYSVLHEGGHAIHAQQWTDFHYDNFYDSMATSAICETHSRFFENIIGRSEEFAPHLLNLCKKHFGDKFSSFDEKSFVAAIRHVEPSLVRTESDEFTYCIHIIIRYRLERDLVNGKIEPKDLPKLWNSSYKQLLGIDVPSDTLGVLQDTHWFSGLFGYFPSYALGNLYGAQILNAMEKEIPFRDLLREGNLAPIIKWMREKEIVHDMLPPGDWIKASTKEDLSPEYFIAYLKNRYIE